MRLYNTKHWQILRLEILKRDSFTCQMCSSLLTDGRGNNRQSILRPAVVDHITPHKGDRDLFFSRSNLWALCCDCHDSTCQQIENKNKLTPHLIRDAKLNHRMIGLDGFKLAPPHRRVLDESNQ